MLSFSLSVATESHAKTAEPIVMPFGMWTCVGPEEVRIRWASIFHTGTGSFECVTSGFPHVLSTSVPICRLQMKSGVTVIFPNEKSRPWDAASRQNYLITCYYYAALQYYVRRCGLLLPTEWHISDLHSKFALRPHHVWKWKYGRHPICDR